MRVQKFCLAALRPEPLADSISALTKSVYDLTPSG